MPEGHDIKKVLYRQLKRARVEITNRIVVTRVLTDADGAACGVLGFDCRTADFLVVRAKAVVLSCGAAGRLGLPACTHAIIKLKVGSTYVYPHESLRRGGGAIQNIIHS